MAKQEKAVTKDMVVGLQIVDSDGKAVGKVKDVAFVIGKMELSLYVEGKKGNGHNVSWAEVQAIGDFVILKPPQTEQPQATAQTCPMCGGPLRYIAQYQKWWCDKDRKYV